MEITTPKDTGTRERLLEAAIACFGENGYAATRIADIAGKAGLGKGTIYEYWRAKEEILLDACLLACRADSVETEARVAEIAGPQVPPVRAVHDLLRTVAGEFLGRDPGEQRLFHELSIVAAGLPELAARAREEMSRKLAMWQGLAAELLERGVASGDFRAIADSEMAARWIVAGVDGLIWQQGFTADVEPEELAARTAAVVCRMLMTDPGRLEEALG